MIRTFFCQNEHVKLGVRIIHGVLYYLVKQRKIWSEIWGCVLYTGTYYTRVNTVSVNLELFQDNKSSPSRKQWFSFFVQRKLILFSFPMTLPSYARR